jgi:hypothetical protein
MEEKESQTRTWSIFDEQEREAISVSHQHATGAIQSNGSIHSLHKGPHMQQSSSINISPV